MGDWSMLEGQRVDTVGEVLGTTLGTTVTAGAVNTKGGWAQLVAATSYDASGLMVFIGNKSGNLDYLVDIGVGAAASEQVIVPNLVAGFLQAWAINVYYIPVPIPAGTRVAARCQCTTGTFSLGVTISLLSQGFMPSSPLGRVTAYGAATADSGGVSIDPGGVAHTKNTYSQINGVTANPIRALLIGIGNQLNAARTGCYWLVDIAIGAAGSEQIILPDLWIAVHSTGDNIIPSALGPFFVDIPAGVRLAARAQCSTTDATDRLFDIVIYGID